MGDETAGPESSPTRTGGRFATARDFVALVRDAALTLALLVCLCHPSSIRWFLSESHLDELSAFGVSIKADEAEDQVNSARGRLSAALAKAALAEPNAAPAEAGRRPLDAVLSRALKLAERVAPDVIPSAGWVYLGHADAALTHWVEAEPVTTNATLPLKSGTEITVSDEVYVRDVASKPPYAAAPVTGIARVGDRLEIVAVDRAEDGKDGSYVWAKVALRKR